MELDDPKRAIAALRAGLDAGMNHLDTAELYGDGEVETLVGRAIAGRRDEVFLVSKVLPHHASRRGTVAACEASLRRLGVDHLDCYLLHWPGRHALEDTFAAFEGLQRAGKIRSWGVSNFGLDDLEQAWSITGPGKIACNQVLYHVQERAIEPLVSPWCAERGIALVAYSPFGSGGFVSPRSRGGKILRNIADRHAATPHRVALAFLIREPHVLAIPKAAQVEHALDNAKASDLDLSGAELDEIDAAFARAGTPRRDVPTL
jgi:diketogulonate reductase-like aldo/keto reductase